MNRRKWLALALLALPLGVVGMVSASSHARSYICPITGEPLPCEKCCPLNQRQNQEQPYVCPATGEQLPCPLCCPLNQSE